MSVPGLGGWAGKGQRGPVRRGCGPSPRHPPPPRCRTLSPPPSLPRHDVVEVAGLTSFSFGEDDECRYVMIFKKVKGPSSALPCLVFGLCPPPPPGERPGMPVDP